MTTPLDNHEVNAADGGAPPDSTPPAAASVPRRHRVLVGTLFALATIIGFVAVLAVWANRQILNTDNWTNTSSKVLADQDVQGAVAAYAVNQLFSSGQVQAKVRAELPAQLQGLAGPISGGLEALARQVAPDVLGSQKVQDAWRQANHAAHAAFMRIIEGRSSAATSSDNVVALNARAIVVQIADSLGIGEQVAAASSKLHEKPGTITGAAKQAGITLPSSTGQLVIMRSSQLGTVQDIGSAIKGLALLLPLVAFALFALAVWLAKGRRRRALRTTGWCFVAIGLVTLLTRRLLGNDIVDALVKNPANRTAAHDVWTIETSMLHDIAIATVVFGVILVFAAWLAGRTWPAIALRHAMTPTLRDHPATAYATAFAALLIAVVWAPTPAFRQIGYIIAFAVLLALGVHSLRRQAISELPDTHPGDATTSILRGYDERHQPKRAAAGQALADGDGKRIGDLERLAALYADGALTDAEFAAEKASLLSDT
jgi:hypothetical protein